MTKELLAYAQDNVENGEVEDAANKVYFVLALGNRVLSPQTLNNAMIGVHLSNLAIDFLEKNPSVPITPEVEVELIRAKNNEQIVLRAYQEEFNILEKRFASAAKPNSFITPYAALINRNFIKQAEAAYFRELVSLKQDWDAFIRNQQKEAILSSGPATAAFVGIMFAPGMLYTDTIEQLGKINNLLSRSS